MAIAVRLAHTIAVLTIAAPAISGCMVLHLPFEPNSTFRVYTADEKPLGDAQVWVVIYGASVDDSKYIWRVTTDANGMASLSEQRRFQIVGRGPWENHWSWCVEHDGYQPVAGTRADADQMREIVVQLKAGRAAKQCDPTYGFNIGSIDEQWGNARNSGNVSRR